MQAREALRTRSDAMGEVGRTQRGAAVTRSVPPLLTPGLVCREIRLLLQRGDELQPKVAPSTCNYADIRSIILMRDLDTEVVDGEVKVQKAV